MQEVELKPCPFCGWERASLTGRKIVRGYLWDRGVYKYIVSVKCNKCHARGSSVSGLVPNHITECKVPDNKLDSYKGLEQSAIDKWNRRV